MNIRQPFAALRSLIRSLYRTGDESDEDPGEIELASFNSETTVVEPEVAATANNAQNNANDAIELAEAVADALVVNGPPQLSFNIPNVPAIPQPPPARLHGPPPRVPTPPGPHLLTPQDIEKFDKKLCRKVDWRLLPFLFFIVFSVELDRWLYTINQQYFVNDIGMSEDQHKAAFISRDFGYIIGQIPLIMVFSTFEKPSMFLCILWFSWGLVKTGLGNTSTYVGIQICSGLLGVLESAFFYRRRELGARISMLVSICPLVRALFALGLSPCSLDFQQPTNSTITYQYYLKISPVLVLGAAVFCYPRVPNLPRSTECLEAAERLRAVSRLAEDWGWPMRANFEKPTYNWSSPLEGSFLAFRDMKVWFLIPTCFFIGFPILSLSDTRLLCLAIRSFTEGPAPKWSVWIILNVCCGMVTYGGFAADSYRRKYFWITLSQLIASVASVITLSMILMPRIGTMDYPQPIWFAIFPNLLCAYFSLPLVLSWAISCLPWYQQKRAVSIGIITTVMSFGTFYADDGPPMSLEYGEGGLNSIPIGILILCGLGSVIFGFYLKQLLHQANWWMHYKEIPGTPHNNGSRTLEYQFHDLRHSFRFQT
ncbi:major facilitator superfamily domain-containing protein [Hypoxylon trugodes]|uniref:major facilitator superfamily domain-containing protein n=1 Tax=Hypoxylon trugodes TaxID=326681 RepID=UPI00219D6C62|nr:major facilitator superfamily domain-containing protein [Hypoxylon trugodes]KAI1388096.1 major facilitator superfamily domain-containing protein [Hypoxylon trugodes]